MTLSYVRKKMKTPSAFPKPPSNQEREALPGVSALSSVAQGLTSHEVAERLRQFGPTAVPDNFPI